MKRILYTPALAILVCAVASSAGPHSGALVRIDRPEDGVVGRLTNAGVTVVRNAGRYLLAVVDAPGAGTLDRLGVRYRVIDDWVDGKTYYTVSAPSDGRLEALPRMANVIYLEGNEGVVEGDRMLGERLARAGFEVQRVFMRSVTPPRPTPALALQRAPGQANEMIEEMVASVSGPVIDEYVQRLQDFVTRWAIHDSCRAAADWIQSEFLSFGLDSVRYQEISTFYKGNVVAVLPGITQPEQIIVFGGHYDSASNSPTAAPGADDNASGTACVLQCARVLSGYTFERTVVFVAFGAEEQGLEGSEYYAAQASAAGEDIAAMINVDMLGYLAPGDVLDVDVVSNAASEWLRDWALSVAATYVPETPAVKGTLPSSASSDHVAFWDQGYPAIWLWEDSEQPSPYIHTLADTIGLSYNQPRLAEQSTRLAVALVADLAGPVAARDAPAPTLTLEQNVPNPFNPRTMIQFTVPAPGAVVSLSVYNVAGRRVTVLVDEERVSGTRTVWWDGRLGGGRPVASGVYFYRLTGGSQTLTRKLVLVR